MKSKKEELIQRISRDIEEEEKLKYQFLKEASNAKIHKRKGFVNSLQLERREAGLDGVVLKAQEVANLQSHEIEQEERLAAEMGFIRQKEIKEEKLRQHLRENSHELKELENYLRSAYVNKALAAQIAENKAQKACDELCEQRARDVMNIALGGIEEMEKKSILHEKRTKEEYRRALQNQIIEKERLRQEGYMAFMKEKKLFEDTVKKIKDEEDKERAEKFLMKKKLKEEMEQFHLAREMWKARERILIDKENQRLEEITKLKEADEYNRTRGKNNKDKNEQEKEMMVQKMNQEIIAKNKLREERQNLIQMLIENENDEKEKQILEKEREKNLIRRNEARTGYQKLLEEKQKQLRDKKELDARFVAQMNLRIKEEEKRFKEIEESKKLQRIRDGKYNEEKMKENIQGLAEKLKVAQMIVESEEKAAKRREEMIQEERIRILKEHAPHLMGYFPKGCLTEADLHLLHMSGNSVESCSLTNSKP